MLEEHLIFWVRQREKEIGFKAKNSGPASLAAEIMFFELENPTLCNKH